MSIVPAELTKKFTQTEKYMINPMRASNVKILDALDRGATVVTVNKRLAGAARQTFEHAAMEGGLEAWPTPDVLPWATWVLRLWEEAVVSGALPAPELLLTPQQEQHLWANIIAGYTMDKPLQQVAGAARRAQEAWQLIQMWRLPFNEVAFRHNSNTAAFWEWATRFDARCKEQRWLPMARLSVDLQYCIAAGELAAPAELVLIGFDELTPQQQSFLEVLCDSGCDVCWMQLAGKESQTVRVECIDARQEAATAARWVRQQLNDHPKARIGMVVPDLASQRGMIIHALDQVLVPHSLYPGHRSVARPYNISLGLPLRTYPIIGTALRLLGLQGQTIGLEEAGKLIRSPFMAGWEQEAGARSLLDAHLRELGDLDVTLYALRYHASQTGKPYSSPLLAQCLDTWAGAARATPHINSPVQWSEIFAKILKAAGWANGRPLSSEEYQAVEAWRDLLCDFATLEPVTESMALSTAVNILRHMAGERTFQPQSGPVPVQVLGVLEASGLLFDYIWVMGLHDGAWPAPPRPNPFIPLPVQRKAGLPHSSEERELRVSRTITGRLLASADQVVASSPQRRGEEKLRPSPLISELSIVNPESLTLWSGATWRDEVYRSARLAVLEEDPAPPLEPGEAGGGSAVLKLQAACPFRAFAELRLGATPLRQPDIGLDALRRGSLMHRVLEKVWHVLGTHDRLMTMDAAELNPMIETMVGESIAEIANRHPQTFSGRFREMETTRLYRQVLKWLEVEKKRKPFRVVEKEGKHETIAGGVRVRLKVDRIDELADGRKVVIDYKTGEVNPDQWFGDRPEEPQLPLYSMALGDDIAGVLFAQVRAGKMVFKGVTEDEGLVPGVKPYSKLPQTRDAGSWSEVLRDWRVTMERLGLAFHNGEASVDPKQFPATCAYCELTSLCRIKEMSMLGGEPCRAEDRA